MTRRWAFELRGCTLLDHHGENGIDPHRERNVEAMREKREQQVDGQLRKEIDQHEQSEQGIGDSVEIVEGDEQKRREVSNDRHRNVRGVTSGFQTGVRGFHEGSFLVGAAF